MALKMFLVNINADNFGLEIQVRDWAFIYRMILATFIGLEIQGKLNKVVRQERSPWRH